MNAPREIDPAESALSYFSSELRRLRNGAGLSQKELAEQVFFAVSLIGMCETAIRVPSLEFVERCDQVLNGDGVLTRLWPLVNREAYPKNFRAFVDLEAAATEIHSYDPHIVDGLVQTEDYARAVLSRWHEGNDLDEKVAARIRRQDLLEGDKPPFLALMLDEVALRHPVGGPEVMRRQLARLIAISHRARVLVQVLPVNASIKADLGAHLTILSFAEGSPVALVECYGRSQLLGTAEDVTRCRVSYDRGAADALSPEASRDMIASLLEDPSPWTTT